MTAIEAEEMTAKVLAYLREEADRLRAELATKESEQGKENLTLPEAAQRLRLAVTTVQKLCQSGRLGHIRVGRRITISRTDLADFIAASRCAPRSTP